MLVVTSVWESGPLVVAEALELGRPVVSTPVGFVPALITDGVTGRIVPIGDAGVLATTIADVVANPLAAVEQAQVGRQRGHELLGGDALIDAVVAVTTGRRVRAVRRWACDPLARRQRCSPAGLLAGAAPAGAVGPRGQGADRGRARAPVGACRSRRPHRPCRAAAAQRGGVAQRTHRRFGDHRRRRVRHHRRRQPGVDRRRRRRAGHRRRRPRLRRAPRRGRRRPPTGPTDALFGAEPGALGTAVGGAGRHHRRAGRRRRPRPGGDGRRRLRGRSAR